MKVRDGADAIARHARRVRYSIRKIRRRRLGGLCRIETLRLLESGVCAFSLVEMGKILAPALQHRLVNRQNL